MCSRFWLNFLAKLSNLRRHNGARRGQIGQYDRGIGSESSLLAGQIQAQCKDAEIQKNFIQFGQRVTADRGNRRAVGTAVSPPLGDVGVLGKKGVVGRQKNKKKSRVFFGVLAVRRSSAGGGASSLRYAAPRPALLSPRGCAPEKIPASFFIFLLSLLTPFCLRPRHSSGRGETAVPTARRLPLSAVTRCPN